MRTLLIRRKRRSNKRQRIVNSSHRRSSVVERGASTSKDEVQQSREPVVSDWRSRLLPKPDAVASAKAQGTETSEVVGSNPSAGARFAKLIADSFGNRFSPWGSPWRIFHRDQLGEPECRYITRWIFDLGPLGSVRLHHWYGDDDQRALHDHPWGFLTLILRGEYADVTEHAGIERVEMMRRGAVRWRPAEHAHTVRVGPKGAWSLLWTQPKRRYFGFWINRNGQRRWMKANKFFATFGFPPCAD